MYILLRNLWKIFYTKFIEITQICSTQKLYSSYENLKFEKIMCIIKFHLQTVTRIEYIEFENYFYLSKNEPNNFWFLKLLSEFSFQKEKKMIKLTYLVAQVVAMSL